VYGRCTGDVLEVYWRCTGGVLEVYWRCTGGYSEDEGDRHARALWVAKSAMSDNYARMPNVHIAKAGMSHTNHANR
jgi:hypothetical protein